MSDEDDDDDDAMMTSSSASAVGATQQHQRHVNDDLEETHSDIEMGLGSPPPGKTLHVHQLAIVSATV